MLQDFKVISIRPTMLLLGAQKLKQRNLCLKSHTDLSEKKTAVGILLPNKGGLKFTRIEPS